MENQNTNVGILVGGGPAPGINGVISALTLEARSRAHRVIGIYDGFQWLMKGDTKHVKEMDHDDISRIHFQGSDIRTRMISSSITSRWQTAGRLLKPIRL
jgi:6-phosphofructokinase